MAPKGGRGGSSSSGGSSGGSSSSSSSDSGSSSVCPGAFKSTFSLTVTSFTAYCLFFVLTLALLISLCCVRKRHRSASTRQLIGPVYVFALSCMLFSWALVIVSSIVQECEGWGSDAPLGLAITYGIFFRIGAYLLLFLAVWTVNSMLRQRLGPARKFTAHKIISLIIVIVMGVLTVVYIGMDSYETWTTLAPSRKIGRGFFGRHLYSFWQAYTGLSVVSVVFGLILNLHMIRSLKSTVHTSLSDLTFWTSLLTFFLVLYPIIDIIPLSAALYNNFLGRTANYATYYISNFFQVFAFASLLFLAKSRSWEIADGDAYGGGASGVQQPMAQQYTYGYTYGNGQSQSQSQSTVGAGKAQGYNYQQEPVYSQHSEMPAAPVQGYVR